MIPALKTAPTDAANSTSEQPQTLKELEAALKQRIGWVDELVSPFALGLAPDDEPKPH